MKQCKIIKIGSKYFQIYTDGTLIDLQTMKKKPFSLNNHGYLKVCVWCSKSKKNLNRYQHQLLALAFIPNPNNYPMIDHINGIKTDNSLANLRWVNNKMNIDHAYKTGQIKKGGK